MNRDNVGLGNKTIATNYRDINGNPCTLIQLIRKEPEWAENLLKQYRSDLESAHARIAELEKEIAK